MSSRRLPPPAPRALSAVEALEEARRAESARKEAAEEARQKRALAQKLAEEARARFLEERARQEADEARARAEREARDRRRRAEEERQAEEQAARDRALVSRPVRAPAPRTGPISAPVLEGKVLAVLTRLADDLEIEDLYDELRPEVLAVLWQAHVKRARAEGDLRGLAMAQALAGRFEQRSTALVAARVLWRGQEWALWVDLDRKEVIGAFTPADRFLTGL